MEKKPETAENPEEKVEKESETSTKLDEKVKKRERKRPPKNPHYKPTTVNIDDFRRRLRDESRAVLGRAGIYLD